VKIIADKAAEVEEKNEDGYIFVRQESKGKLLRINLDDIDYIEGMKNYVAIYRGGQEGPLFIRTSKTW
jgi:DNA-binding LytR/AlgR family response regulator